MNKINIYDFDGTIYSGDSTIDFYLFCLKNRVMIICYFPIQVWYLILYKLKIKSKKEFKEKFFVFLKDIKPLDKYVEKFWDKNYKKIKEYYIKSVHKNDVIISASPLFLIKVIGKKLKVLDVIATNVSSNGKIIGNNCYGEEKVALFEKKYKNVCVENVYTDSLSDLPIMKLGKKAYIVRKNIITEYKNKENER